MQQWCRQRGRTVGAILTLAQGWMLARAWFTDPRQPGWRRPSLQTLATLMRKQGCAGPFWDLPAGPPE